MTPRFVHLYTAGVALFLLAGCGKKSGGEHAGHDHSEHAGGGEAPSVTFKPGRGLQLPPEVLKALALRTADAEERPLAAELRLDAQVFALAPQVLAVARVPAAAVARWEKATFPAARLRRIDRTAERATGLVDLVFALAPASHPPAPGDAVALVATPAAQSAPVLTVPRSAVLEAAGGTFVFVVNGATYLRTAVKTGARSADHVEITDGLYAGDTVVTTAVDQLWLAELRLTKGGGHSH